MNRQPDWNQVVQSPQAAELLKDRPALESMLQSQDAKRLLQLMQQQSGDQLDALASQAEKGDIAAVAQLMRQVMGSKDGAELVQNLTRQLKK